MRNSYFQGEQDVLISPQARIIVASITYTAPDSFPSIDMVEMHGTVFIS